MQVMYDPLQLMPVILAALSSLSAYAAVVPDMCQSNSTSSGTNATKVRMTWYANWESGDNPPFSLTNLSWSQYNRVSYSFL